MSAGELLTSKKWLPCPFCGDRDIRSRHRGHPTSGQWVIECGSCSCELTGFASQQDAWACWNKRPAPETPQPASKELALLLCRAAGWLAVPEGESAKSTRELIERLVAAVKAHAYETPVQPGELEQLRRIDQAARAFVNACPGKTAGKAYEALSNALFDGRPAQETEVGVPRDGIIFIPCERHKQGTFTMTVGCVALPKAMCPGCENERIAAEKAETIENALNGG